MVEARKGRVMALTLAACVAGLLVLVLVLFRDDLTSLFRRDGRADRPIPAASGPLAGTPVNIAAGEIPLEEFLRFLSEFTDLPVVYDSNDKRFAGVKIRIVAPIQNVTAEVIRAILAAHGFRVVVDKLPDGGEILRVEVLRSGER